MNIQYCHVRKYVPEFNLSNFTYESQLEARGGETIAMEEIEASVVSSLQAGDFFTKLVGKARCSNEENYNKKTGRELAKQRMKKLILTIMSNMDFGGVRTLILIDEDGKLYHLENRPGARIFHFVGYE